MTIEEFNELIAFLEGAFRQDMTQNQRDAYWSILRNYDFDGLMEAVRELASSSAQLRFPIPGDLLDALHRHRKLEGSDYSNSERPVSRTFAKKCIAQMVSMLKNRRR